LTIGVADVPTISNFTDFDALAREPDVDLLRVKGMTDRRLDALILPGSKNTREALRFIKARGIELVARLVLAQGGTVVGLCGGFQVLGRKILDPEGIESAEAELDGLGLLDTMTTFEPEKVTVEAAGIHRETGCPVQGYEVHMGRTRLGKNVRPLLEVQRAGGTERYEEGAVSADGKVFGTYLHGLFDAPEFRRLFLNRLRGARGWSPLASGGHITLDQQLDGLADFIQKHVDLPAVETIIEQGL
jgi:adenosylcobyric acid synthase